MKIVLVDNSIEGHRITYLKCIALSMLSVGHSVHIICPYAKELYSELENKIVFHEYPVIPDKKYFITRFNWSLNVLNRWVNLSTVIKNSIVDAELVFFTFVDYYRFSLSPMIHSRLKFFVNRIDLILPFLLDRVFPYKWAGLSLQPQYRIDSIFTAKNCLAICILNERFRFDYKVLDNKILLFPDISDLRIRQEKSVFAKSILKKANGRKIIGLIGALSKRKSIIQLLDVAQLMQSEPYFFFFAGEKHFYSFTEFENDRLETLEKRGLDNCYFHFERIEDGYSFNELIVLSDIVFASYLQFRDSSNLLTKIAYFRKPIIVSASNLMCERVREYNMGVCINEGKISEIEFALKNFNSVFDKGLAKFDDYFNRHSSKALMIIIEKIIQRVNNS